MVRVSFQTLHRRVRCYFGLLVEQNKQKCKKTVMGAFII